MRKKRKGSDTNGSPNLPNTLTSPSLSFTSHYSLEDYTLFLHFSCLSQRQSIFVNSSVQFQQNIIKAFSARMQVNNFDQSIKNLQPISVLDEGFVVVILSREWWLWYFMELKMLVMVIICDCKISITSRTFESTDDKAIA